MIFKELEQENNLRPENLPKFIDYGEIDKMAQEDRRNTAYDLMDEYDLTPEEAEILVRYFDDFDLTLDNLIGKRVLDVGSGPGDFKKAVNKLGEKFNIINFDRGIVWEDAMDVKGDALNMPFRDESFDFVLAHGSVPLMYATRGKHNLISPTLKEMFRIVRRGGVLKVFPVAIDNPGYPEESKEYAEMEREVLKGLNVIHGQSPEIKAKISEVKDPDQPAVRRYLLEVFR